MYKIRFDETMEFWGYNLKKGDVVLVGDWICRYDKKHFITVLSHHKISRRQNISMKTVSKLIRDRDKLIDGLSSKIEKIKKEYNQAINVLKR